MNEIKCINCDVIIENAHRNRKFCSDKCNNKFRYRKEGQRSTTKQRQEWYKNRVSDQAYRDKLNNQGIVRYNKIQEFLRNYKIEKGCNDCSYNVHHVALDFDHIIGIKKINVCNAKSIDQAKEEILKCEVVCSNCHRIRTYERLQSLRK